MRGRILSASQINTWLACHRKWAYRYVEKAPREFRASALALGSAVHSSLDWLHAEKLDGRTPEPAKVAEIFRADWDAEQEEPLRFKEGESFDELRSTGETLVQQYAERLGDTAIEATELAFEVPLVDPETGEILDDSIRGYIDLLLVDDTLVEIKTAARRISDDDLRRRLQLSAYAYAHRLRRGRSPKLAVVSLLKTRRPAVEIATTERTPDDDAFFVHLASEVSRGMDSGAHPPNPGWQCADCEFQRTCSSWRGPAPNPSDIVPDALAEIRIQLGENPWTAELPR